MSARQPWLFSAWVDGILILAPAWVTALLAWAFRSQWEGANGVPVWAWVVLVLCIDVAHVYGTLFRTYLNKAEFKRRRNQLMAIPLAVWVVGCLLYSLGALAFWRVLAYLAVFHFMRQQYGFMRLYSRKDGASGRASRWLDAAVIYLATLYPILYWHSHPRNFHWFVDGDFAAGLHPGVAKFAGYLYLAVGFAYLVKEGVASVRIRSFNIPKNAIVLGTAISWYMGIVVVNGDMAFTVTNVVSHGVPYLALVWTQGRKSRVGGNASSWPFSLRAIPLFIGFLLLLAFLEEGIWDGMVWREHASVFSVFWGLPEVSSHSTLSWLIPLLSLPQSVHYVLDGFIWRLREGEVL